MEARSAKKHTKQNKTANIRSSSRRGLLDKIQQPPYFTIILRLLYDTGKKKNRYDGAPHTWQQKCIQGHTSTTAICNTLSRRPVIGWIAPPIRFPTTQATTRNKERPNVCGDFYSAQHLKGWMRCQFRKITCGKQNLSQSPPPPPPRHSSPPARGGNLTA